MRERQRGRGNRGDELFLKAKSRQETKAAPWAPRPHTPPNAGELLLNLLTPLHTLLHLIKGPASKSWLNYIVSPTFLEDSFQILIFLTGWEGRRLPSNYPKDRNQQIFIRKLRWHFVPLPLCVIGKTRWKPPTPILSWDSSLTLFFIQGLREECVCTPSTTFKQCFFFLWEGFPSSPIYLSVTLLLHTWIYEKAFHLCNSILSFHIAHVFLPHRMLIPV